MEPATEYHKCILNLYQPILKAFSLGEKISNSPELSPQSDKRPLVNQLVSDSFGKKHAKLNPYLIWYLKIGLYSCSVNN
jgi:hypothetical protein